MVNLHHCSMQISTYSSNGAEKVLQYFCNLLGGAWGFALAFDWVLVKAVKHVKSWPAGSWVIMAEHGFNGC